MSKWTLLAIGLLIQVQVFSQKTDSVSSDIPYFIQYPIDSTISVRKIKNVKFYSEGVEDLLLKETEVCIDTLDGREQYYNELLVQAYEAKTHYQTERWRISAANEKFHKLYYGEYYVSVSYGCCGSEDEYQLYSLKSGRKISSVTYYNSCYRPFRGMVTYLSTRTVNYADKDWSKGVIGVLGLYYDKTQQSSAKILKMNVSNLSVQYSEVDFTPDIYVFDKQEITKKKESFYSKAAMVNAEYFMILEYDEDFKIIIPFANEIPLLSSVIVSKPSLKVSFKK